MIEKAIVTGASGFIGQALIGYLSRQGIEVIAVSRQPESSKRELPGVQWFQADIREPGCLNDFLGPNTNLYHLAGHTSVPGSVKAPLNDFENNVQAFLKILESVREAGGRIVFTSSPAVFASGQPLPLSETAVKKPTSPYGAGKLACEGYAQSYHACFGVDVRIARIFNVYGPGMRRFAIHDFWTKLKNNPLHLELLGHGDQLRDYLYISDAVAALKAIADFGQPGDDYNVASGIPVNTTDLARRVARLMGYPSVEVSCLGFSFPGDIPQWYADVTKLKSIFDPPLISLTDGLTETLNWFEANLTENPSISRGSASASLS